MIALRRFRLPVAGQLSWQWVNPGEEFELKADFTDYFEQTGKARRKGE